MTPDAGKGCIQDVLRTPVLVAASAEGNRCTHSTRETEQGSSGPVERGVGAGDGGGCRVRCGVRDDG